MLAIREQGHEHIACGKHAQGTPGAVHHRQMHEPRPLHPGPDVIEQLRGCAELDFGGHRGLDEFRAGTAGAMADASDDVRAADHTTKNAALVADDDQQGLRAVEGLRGVDQSRRAIDRDKAAAGPFEKGRGDHGPAPGPMSVPGAPGFCVPVLTGKVARVRMCPPASTMNRQARPPW